MPRQSIDPKDYLEILQLVISTYDDELSQQNWVSIKIDNYFSHTAPFAFSSTLYQQRIIEPSKNADAIEKYVLVLKGPNIGTGTLLEPNHKINTTLTELSKQVTHCLEQMIKKMQSTNFSIYVTGYSLGGWLAELVVGLYTIENMRKSEIDYMQIQGVTFDHPGVVDFLEDFRGIRSPQACPNIVTFLSFPNALNCSNNTHLGQVYQLPSHVMKDMDAILRRVYEIIPYNKKNLLLWFSEVGEGKCYPISKWPLLKRQKGKNIQHPWIFFGKIHLQGEYYKVDADSFELSSKDYVIKEKKQAQPFSHFIDIFLKRCKREYLENQERFLSVLNIPQYAFLANILQRFLKNSSQSKVAIEVTKEIQNEVYNSLCKYARDSGDLFLSLSLLDSQQKLSSSHWTWLPDRSSSYFQEREGYMACINHQLKRNSAVVLVSESGMGKTVLMYQYAKKESQKYMDVRWLDMREGVGELSLRNFADSLGIPVNNNNMTDLANCIYTHEKVKTNTWLLIFDNVQSYEEISAYLPKERRENQHILIASNNSQAEWPACFKRTVGPFTFKEGFAFLSRRLHSNESNERTLLSKNKLKGLIKQLGRLPLALEMAEMYFYEKKAYTEELQNELFQEKITIQRLCSNIMQNLKPETRKLLRHMSYLHPDGVSRTLLLALCGEDESAESALEESLKELCKQTIIHRREISSRESWAMHPLFHTMVREDYQNRKEHHENPEKLDEKAEYLFNALSKHFANDLEVTTEKLNTLAEELKHIRFLLDKTEKLSSRTIQIYKAKLYIILGQGKIRLSYYNDAWEVLDMALAKWKELGENSETFDGRSKVQYFLGQIYFYEDDYEAAESAFKESIVLNRKRAKSIKNEKNDTEQAVIIRQINQNIADLMHWLGYVLLRKSLYFEAGKKFSHALRIKYYLYKNELNHPTIADTEHALGTVYYYLGKYDIALSQYQKSLEMKDRQPEKNQSEIAGTLYWRGSVYDALGKTELAEKDYQDSLKKRNEYYKKTLNADIARSRMKLGRICIIKGKEKHEKALKYLNLAYDLMHKIFGENAKKVFLAEILHEYGNLYQAKEEYSKAREKYNESKRMFRVIFNNENHSKIAKNIYEIGRTYQCELNITEAVNCYDQALSILDNVYGEKYQHPFYDVVLESLEIALKQNYIEFLFEECENSYLSELVPLARKIAVGKTMEKFNAAELDVFSKGEKIFEIHKKRKDFHQQILLMKFFWQKAKRFDKSVLLKMLREIKSDDTWFKMLVQYLYVTINENETSSLAEVCNDLLLNFLIGQIPDERHKKNIAVWIFFIIKRLGFSEEPQCSLEDFISEFKIIFKNKAWLRIALEELLNLVFVGKISSQEEGESSMLKTEKEKNETETFSKKELLELLEKDSITRCSLIMMYHGCTKNKKLMEVRSSIEKSIEIQNEIYEIISFCQDAAGMHQGIWVASEKITKDFLNDNKLGMLIFHIPEKAYIVLKKEKQSVMIYLTSHNFEVFEVKNNLFSVLRHYFYRIFSFVNIDENESKRYVANVFFNSMSSEERCFFGYLCKRITGVNKVNDDRIHEVQLFSRENRMFETLLYLLAHQNMTYFFLLKEVFLDEVNGFLLRNFGEIFFYDHEKEVLQKTENIPSDGNEKCHFYLENEKMSTSIQLFYARKYEAAMQLLAKLRFEKENDVEVLMILQESERKFMESEDVNILKKVGLLSARKSLGELFEDAVKLYNKATLKQSPEKEMIKKEEFEQLSAAYNLFNQVLNIFSYHKESFLYKARILYLNNQPSDAISMLNELAALCSNKKDEPILIETFLTRGVILLDMDLPEDAKVYFDIGLKRSKGNQDLIKIFLEWKEKAEKKLLTSPSNSCGISK